MGSQASQSTLWGRNAKDWADIQEETGLPGYQYVLQQIHLSPADTLLDIGCGSGLFCQQATATGAAVTGFDATEALIQQAKERVPTLPFFTGEMEALPFPDNSFDIVTGFNSFQYAASIANAFAEAKRVVKPGGRLAVMIWGNKEDCEAASFLAAIGSLLPPPPPGAPGPFALTENNRLQQLLADAGFTVTKSTDIPNPWDYPDVETALKGLLSSGPSTRAIDHSGYEKVRATILQSMQPYIRANGRVTYANTNRIVLASPIK